MENASKALVIAGTVLIAVFILSVGIYVFVSFSEVSYKNEEENSKQAIAQYNNKFTKYEGTDMTIHDVVTLVNLAKDYNERKSDRKITVSFRNEPLEERSKENIIDLLKNSGTYYIKGDITYYDVDKKYIRQIEIGIKY